MDSSGHSRNSSMDGGINENDPHRYRECDDMLSRRMAGNLPAPLRKKRNEENYKKFITPTGDPMQYVQQHMRSKSMSDLAVEKHVQDELRDERNERYEELQHLKEVLKEEEETWTSNLANWKNRRRSATLDVLRRKEDRDSVGQHQNQQSKRKPKTYKEMVEDKKRRDLNLFDDDGHLSSHLNIDDNETNQSSYTATDNKPSKKVPYRGAISVPNIQSCAKNTRTNANQEEGRPPRRSKSPSVVARVQPITYTSKVTAQISHVPTESEDSDVKADNSSQSSGNKYSPRSPSVTPRSETSRSSVNEPKVPQTYSSTYSAPVRPRSQSPPLRSTYSTTAAVVMRKRDSPVKPRPKSEYSPRDKTTDRAATLPRNYHNYSAPKPFVAGASSFVQYRKTQFASKRNMWENIGNKDPEPTHNNAPNLAALLKNDTDQTTRDSTDDEDDGSDRFVSNGIPAKYSQPVSQQKATPTENYEKPANANPAVRSWQKDILPSKQKESSYRQVSAPQTWNKSASLPRGHTLSTYQTKKAEPVQNGINSEKTLRPYSQNPAPNNPISKVSNKSLSPRAGATDPLFDDMKICINQRPRSEKGFGFTVRGGDEGKPVIVNTVSPGGAADICQLCVGDEILAINDVQLSSSLTQDGIVKLIVDSVITGSLSLDIRRYGKSKKTNPLRLSGTKVVMTPGGFVQVRSDRGKSPVVSTKMLNGNSSHNNYNKIESRQNDLPDDDLPPPPQHLINPQTAPKFDTSPPPKRESAMSRLSPKRNPTSPNYRNTSPLSNLIGAASHNKNHTADARHIRQQSKSPPRHSPHRHGDEEEEDEARRAQDEILQEEAFRAQERKRLDHDNQLKYKLLEEQRSMEEREARREEERRKRMEDAKRAEEKLEEELKRIEELKQQQQKIREEEKRRLLSTDNSGIQRKSGSTKSTKQPGLSHWLIEEAERKRVAEEEGRHRANALEYSRNPSAGGGGLPDHVIQHLTNRTSSRNSQLPGTLTELWNDPNAQATLL